MPNIAEDTPNVTRLLMGNEAIARGALEAGVAVAAAYPGTPSTEIVETLATAGEELNLYVEWSVNEKVALETAVAASFSGLRGLTAMKQNGLNVALDFLSNLSVTGIKGGLVLVVCDDPGAISSTNEQDSRYVAKGLDLPLLEPATFQEAKDMTKWAFELSEEISNVCIVRSVTRISHGRGNVRLGKLSRGSKQAHFDTSGKPYAAIGMVSKRHKVLHQNLAKTMELYNSSPFNWYVGPRKPELLIVTCGSGWFYSLEAVKMLSLEKRVGILKLGTTWPLPKELVAQHMLENKKILVVEEIDPFLEHNLKEIAADLSPGRTWTFYGKESGSIEPFGEMNPDIVIQALANIFNVKYLPREVNYEKKCAEIVNEYVPHRELQYCAGCPHRAAFWAIKDALKLKGGDPIVTGDIGCYGMACGPTGYFQTKTMHSMGSGTGIASGLGKLGQFGSNQPVLATCGDSTFFHAAMPALINAMHSESNLILIFFDNAGTAMTGFQPHPGTDKNAFGKPAPKADIESLCHALGIPVVVTDPYDVNATRESFLRILQDEKKTRVIICRRECALIRAREGKPLYKVFVDPAKCIGEACGCARLCVRVFKCPGLSWNRDTKKAEIAEGICTHCGVCADVCPRSAIIREANG